MPRRKASPLLFLLLVLFFLFLHIQGQEQQLSQDDLAALRLIRDSLTDLPASRHLSPPSTTTGLFFSSWDFSSRDPCSTFAGVTCSSPFLTAPRRVTALILGTGLSDSPGLAGSLPAAISNLTELNQLVLYAGIVTGSIPPQLGRLTNLRVLSLTNNRLTGSIPPGVFSLPNLHTLDLSNNQLSGSIPPDISSLAELKVLILSSNRLTGEIPTQLPPQLLHFDLKNNGFSGMLLPPPPNTRKRVQLPPSLHYLSLSGNKLWGPLNGLESLSELVFLDLSMNTFSGPIPTSLLRPSLSSILLQRNNLSGGVHPSWTSESSSYGSGSIVDLSHNTLTGELPLFSGVETVFLNNNKFTGKVPKEYVESLYSGRTKTLYLQHNYLTEFPLLMPELKFPESVSVCLSYNCMVPPPSPPVGAAVGLTSACPASAGEQLSRPAYQCSKFNDGGSTR